MDPPPYRNGVEHARIAAPRDTSERVLLVTEEGLDPELLPLVLAGLLPDELAGADAVLWYPLAAVRADGLAPTLYAGAVEPWMYAETLRRLVLFRIRPRLLVATEGVATRGLEGAAAVVRMPVAVAVSRGVERRRTGLRVDVRPREHWAAASRVDIRPAPKHGPRTAAGSPSTRRFGVVLRTHVAGNGSIAHLTRLLAIALDRTLGSERAVWLEDVVGKPLANNATMSREQRADVARIAQQQPAADDGVVASVRTPFAHGEEALLRGGALDWHEHVDAPQYMWAGTACSDIDTGSESMRTMLGCVERWLAVSSHARRALLAAGVDPGRVEVLPHPVDDRLLGAEAAEPRQSHPFTILNVSASSAELKGVDVLLKATANAFGGDRGFVLQLHERKGGLEQLLADDVDSAAARDRLGDRLVVTTGPLAQHELARLYAAADVYVQPSRAEASGLTALEAACCGTPSVATAWSGPVDYIEGSAVIPLAYTLAEARPARPQPLARGSRGLWAEPSVEHLVEILRDIREHREERSDAALSAAPALRARFGLDAIGSLAERLLFDESAWGTHAALGREPVPAPT